MIHLAVYPTVPPWKAFNLCHSCQHLFYHGFCDAYEQILMSENIRTCPKFKEAVK